MMPIYMHHVLTTQCNTDSDERVMGGRVYSERVSNSEGGGGGGGWTYVTE